MDNYSEYYAYRKQSDFGKRLVEFWHKRMLTLAMKRIPQLRSKTILEIGAGHGHLAKICKEENICYYGHEMNDTQANCLRAEGYAVTAATIPPIPAGVPVQVIWLSHVLEHANSFQDAKAMLLACHDRLDKNGYLVVIAPDIHHWKTEFWSVDWSHGFPTSLNRVKQLLNETNFQVTSGFHHSCTLTNPFLAWILSVLFNLTLPVSNCIDFILDKLIGKQFCHSFLGVFGFRQIYLVAKKG